MRNPLVVEREFVALVCAAGTVCMVLTTGAERLVERGVRLFIQPSPNIPGDTTARHRLDAALREYKRRIAGV